ncbi:hypothetical protein MN205_08270 [Kineococcus sp. TRM81007]|uniref:hypothetical protein n=1 Tax=Kineococcus sp. TRM81007 TaxID=2925831 RepID=UPI001F59CAB7|nr:hypothetical protein [Kineococcus sp. TRM81007]MCI2238489.1 hypothetical protein [Kineococcus sp. TRM81007]
MPRTPGWAAVAAATRTLLGSVVLAAIAAAVRAATGDGQPGDDWAGALLPGAFFGLLTGTTSGLAAFLVHAASGRLGAARVVFVLLAAAWTAVVLGFAGRLTAAVLASAVVAAVLLSLWSLAPLRHVPPMPRG